MAKAKRKAASSKKISEQHPFVDALLLVFAAVRPKNIRRVRYDEVVKRHMQEQLTHHIGQLGKYVVAGDAMEAAWQGVAVGALYDQLCLFDTLGSGEKSRRAMRKGRSSKAAKRDATFYRIYPKVKASKPDAKESMILSEVNTRLAAEGFATIKNKKFVTLKKSLKSVATT